jgi:hypothetical protein
MRILGIVALGAALAGCAVTLISKDGQILRGTTTASLAGGTFEATDGKGRDAATAGPHEVKSRHCPKLGTAL